jgi:hypothetical protein
MPPQDNDTVQIPNAPWWENNSYVVVKEDFLEEDSAWVQNHLNWQARTDRNNKQNSAIDAQIGNVNILTIQRMVVQGLVAVKRRDGRIKTVNLPTDAGKLLKNDSDYIMAEINKLNPDMAEEAQEAFLASANGQSKGNLNLVKPFLTSS